MKRFDGRVVVITGGGTGIGRAICEAAAAEGAHVVVAGRTAATIEDVVERIGGRAVPCDVTKLDDVEALFAIARSITSKVDVLVNNAGTTGPLDALADTDVAAWRDCIEVNLIGAMHCMHVAAGIMRAQACGSIINMSSRMGLVGAPERSAYSASKFALNGLTQALAREVGSFGVRVNAVCPGPVRGEMMDRVVELAAAQEGRPSETVAYENYLRHAALGRWVEPPDVAETVLFLASDAASAITGEHIRVDCGRF
jgi:NAD(P)-dependent dehydrogenase (short-subunit alcohol dehydrogenase family)